MWLSRFFPFQGHSRPASRSLYLPLVPAPKVYPIPRVSLPERFLEETVGHLPQILFPFMFGKGDVSEGISNFENTIKSMASDREVVFFVSVRVLADPAKPDGERIQCRLEVCFGQPLLKRLYLRNAGEAPTIASLSELVMVAHENASKFTYSQDEMGDCWMRLRGAPTLKEGGHFTDATFLVRVIQQVITVVIGERDDDIDAWHRYECYSLPAKQWLLERRPTAAHTPD